MFDPKRKTGQDFIGKSWQILNMWWLFVFLTFLIAHVSSSGCDWHHLRRPSDDHLLLLSSLHATCLFLLSIFLFVSHEQRREWNVSSGEKEAGGAVITAVWFFSAAKNDSFFFLPSGKDFGENEELTESARTAKRREREKISSELHHETECING